MDSEVKDIQGIADKGKDSLTRKELGKLFNVSHEAIRIWEESGKLLTLGWERIPHSRNPVRYSRTSQSLDPASVLS